MGMNADVRLLSRPTRPIQVSAISYHYDGFHFVIILKLILLPLNRVCGEASAMRSRTPEIRF